MVGLTHIGNDPANLQAVIDVIDRDGGVIIDDFVDRETLEAIKADLLPQLSEIATGPDEFFGKKTRRLSRLFARTTHCAGIVTNPLFLESARHFICRPHIAWAGEEQYELAPELHIGMSQLIQIGPDEGAQPLHRDDGAFQWSRSFGREARLQIMVAVSDFTAENGGTLVIPGSNKWDDNRAPKRSEAISTEMKAGSALLFVGGTFHAGGQNQTESELRTGLTMSLDAANVRQEENFYLSMTREEVARYPEAIQRLLGWSLFGRALGWIEVNGQLSDPNTLLHDAG
jgi:ectoine hydroxylase-related dioxygenase (phytanoyl-CoA dioxygenase family)